MPTMPDGAPPLCAPRTAVLLLWWLLPSLMVRCCCRLSWLRRSTKPSLNMATLPELMPDMLASLR